MAAQVSITRQVSRAGSMNKRLELVGSARSAWVLHSAVLHATGPCGVAPVGRAFTSLMLASIAESGAAKPVLQSAVGHALQWSGREPHDLRRHGGPLMLAYYLCRGG